MERKGKETMMVKRSFSLGNALVFCLVLLVGCTTGGSQSTLTPTATSTSTIAVQQSTLTPTATPTSTRAVPPPRLTPTAAPTSTRAVQQSTLPPTAAPANMTAHWLYVVDDGAISI